LKDTTDNNLGFCSTILTRVVGLGLEPKTIEVEAGKNVVAEIEAKTEVRAATLLP